MRTSTPGLSCVKPARRGISHNEAKEWVVADRQRPLPSLRAGRHTVWITEENQPKDVVLEPGTSYQLLTPGLAIVHAIGGEASVTLN